MADETELVNAIAKTSPTPRLRSKENIAFVCHSIASTFLRTPSSETLAYLKILSDCYTLFAFLSATPDVQRITKKMFDHGEIWLDTATILPALAEWSTDNADFNEKPFRLLFRQLNGSGLSLYVSEGVIEEILSHLHRCVTFARATSWTGNVPYVAAQFMLRGGSAASLPSFVEEFRGAHKPEEDLAQFLSEEFGIELRELSRTEKLPESVVDEIRAYWQDATDRRRKLDVDQILNMRLARHDADNYLNVLARRSSVAQATWQGYTSWWLTIDGYARRLIDEVSPETRSFIRHQPILSLDFLTRYLTFGPVRTRIERGVSNPLELYAAEIAEAVPMELISAAQLVRKKLQAVSERRKIRMITAALDEQRASFGPVHAAGIEHVGDAIVQGM